MTVENQTNKIIANGNGVATVFSFTPMVIFATTDLEVFLLTAAGVETLLVEGVGSTNYSVAAASGSYPSANGVAGNVTYPADTITPLPSGDSITMKRVLTLEQQTDLENQGGYFPDVQETQFDKGIMIDLQQEELLDRVLVVPVTDTAIDLTLPSATARASSTFIWDSSGLPSSGAASTAAVSVAMEPVVASSTVAAALVLLGGIAADDSGIDLNLSEGADVASAATTDVWITDGNALHVTGTTTITSLSTAPNAGAWRIVIFDGILTLTNGASLILPSGANITTASGDMMLVYADTTTIARVAYWPADGKPVATIDTADITNSAVTTLKINDDSVTLAKMAGGTDGELITYDASGDPTTVPVGTSGQALTSNGPGATPTFQTAGGVSGDVQTFTSNDTWTKPSSGTYALVECWGAGGSGGAQTTANRAGGGGGGGYTYAWFLISTLGVTETVTLGVGGTAVAPNTDGNDGTDTTFGAHLTAFGGGGGGASASGTAAGGGGGGGWNSRGLNGGIAATINGPGMGGSGEGGGSWTATVSAEANHMKHGEYGGGGGGASPVSGVQVGGSSAYGGGGGGGERSSGAGGTSTFGGDGGAGNSAGSGVAGTQPGGGGGAADSGTSGAGAAGQVVVSVY